MPPQEQAELWMALRDRMKVDWKDLTTQEKKAGEYSNVGDRCALRIEAAKAWPMGAIGRDLTAVREVIQNYQTHMDNSY